MAPGPAFLCTDVSYKPSILLTASAIFWQSRPRSSSLRYRHSSLQYQTILFSITAWICVLDYRFTTENVC